LAEAPPVDEQTGLPVHERLAGASRVPHDDGAPTRRSLHEDVPPPFDLETRPTRPTRHREDVTHRVVAREIVLADLAREQDRAARGSGRELAEIRFVRAAPDDEQRRVGNPAPDRRDRTDQHVLTLARDEPADADDERPPRDPQGRTDVPRL